ncbi:MAG TPA: hypothetical protein VJ870_13435 [Amycolatopsis sp.]|nr:hypothetical protein [Amycolatopsis sp.]
MTNRNANPGDAAEQLVATEFMALRGDLLKHIELQFQLVAVSVVALGTILSVGYQTRNAAIMSLYPLVSLILGIYWLNMAHTIIRVGTYLKEVLEPLMSPAQCGWEHYVRKNPIRGDAIGFWGVRGIFLGGPVVALISALTTMEWSATNIVAFVLGAVTTVGTFVVFLVWSERTPGQ